MIDDGELGCMSETEGERVKPELRHEMPEDVAGRFVDCYRTSAGLTLRYWRGSFWLWSEGRYGDLSPGDLRATLLPAFLQQHYRGISANAVGNVMVSLPSLCHIDSKIEPGAWIGDGDGDDPTAACQARDVMVTPTKLIHLPSTTIVPNSPNYMSHVCLGDDYVERAPKAKRWRKFLGEVFDDDADSIRLLQQWMGYLLTVDTSMQKIMLMVGPKRSGKGTHIWAGFDRGQS